MDDNSYAMNNFGPPVRVLGMNGFVLGSGVDSDTSCYYVRPESRCSRGVADQPAPTNSRIAFVAELGFFGGFTDTDRPAAQLLFRL